MWQQLNKKYAAITAVLLDSELIRGAEDNGGMSMKIRLFNLALLYTSRSSAHSISAR
jgi:hypothetical protein